MKKIILVLLFIALAGAGYGQEVSRIVARVNNEVVTSGDLDELLSALAYNNIMPDPDSPQYHQLRKKVLTRLIEDKLIVDEAKRQGVDVNNPTVENKLREMISVYKTQEAFEASLVEKGLNMTLARKRIREQFILQGMVERYVWSQVNVSPFEISQYYLDHSREFFSPRKYILRIAKSTERDNLDRIAKVIGEEGIDSAGQIYSGSLIAIEYQDFEVREEIARPLSKIKAGEYIIQEIDGQDHLIYLEEIIDPAAQSLQEVKEIIYRIIEAQKVKVKFQAWIAELKEKAIIKVYLDE